MKRTHSLALTAPLLTGLAASPAAAARIDLTVTIPQLKVAEYHRPYVAIYLEQTGQPVRNLALWYDSDNREDGGRKWLTELRQWWRKSGRTLKLPADGITGATRAPGPQKIAFAAGKAPLGTLAPGEYTLVVEAAREVGGKEALRLPFAWPAKGLQTVAATGTTELGAVTATIKP